MPQVCLHPVYCHYLQSKTSAFLKRPLGGVALCYHSVIIQSVITTHHSRSQIVAVPSRTGLWASEGKKSYAGFQPPPCGIFTSKVSMISRSRF